VETEELPEFQRDMSDSPSQVIIKVILPFRSRSRIGLSHAVQHLLLRSMHLVDRLESGFCVVFVSVCVCVISTGI